MHLFSEILLDKIKSCYRSKMDHECCFWLKVLLCFCWFTVILLMMETLNSAGLATAKLYANNYASTANKTSCICLKLTDQHESSAGDFSSESLKLERSSSAWGDEFSWAWKPPSLTFSRVFCTLSQKAIRFHPACRVFKWQILRNVA